MMATHFMIATYFSQLLTHCAKTRVENWAQLLDLRKLVETHIASKQKSRHIGLSNYYCSFQKGCS